MNDEQTISRQQFLIGAGAGDFKSVDSNCKFLQITLDLSLSPSDWPL